MKKSSVILGLLGSSIVVCSTELRDRIKSGAQEIVDQLMNDAETTRMRDELAALVRTRDEWLAKSGNVATHSIKLINNLIIELETELRSKLNKDVQPTAKPDSTAANTDVAADNLRDSSIAAASDDISIPELETKVAFEDSANFDPVVTKHPEASCAKEEASSGVTFGEASDVTVDAVNSRLYALATLPVLEELISVLSGSHSVSALKLDTKSLLDFISKQHSDYYHDMHTLVKYRNDNEVINYERQLDVLSSLQSLMRELGLPTTKYEVGTTPVYATPAEVRAIVAVAGILQSYGYAELAGNVKCAAGELTESH